MFTDARTADAGVVRTLHAQLDAYPDDWEARGRLAEELGRSDPALARALDWTARRRKCPVRRLKGGWWWCRPPGPEGDGDTAFDLPAGVMHRLALCSGGVPDADGW